MKGDSLQGLIEYIAQALVDDPSQVQVEEVQGGNHPRLELRVAREDMGRVIGKRGRVANSMRMLLRVAAARQGKQANLEIVEPL
ncbi:MAG: KH domain-containing protein [Chloroflexota bacterium]